MCHDYACYPCGHRHLSFAFTPISGCSAAQTPEIASVIVPASMYAAEHASAGLVQGLSQSWSCDTLLLDAGQRAGGHPH